MSEIQLAACIADFCVCYTWGRKQCLPVFLGGVALKISMTLLCSCAKFNEGLQGSLAWAWVLAKSLSDDESETFPPNWHHRLWLYKEPRELNFPRNTNAHANCWKSNQVVEPKIHAAIKRKGENLIVLIFTSLYLFVCVATSNIFGWTKYTWRPWSRLWLIDRGREP